MSELTEDERETLGGPEGPWIKDDWDGLLAAVEAILDARLARVEALADEWLRAALASGTTDAHTTQTGGAGS